MPVVRPKNGSLNGGRSPRRRGFFALADHGVDMGLIERAYGQAKEFFLLR